MCLGKRTCLAVFVMFCLVGMTKLSFADLILWNKLGTEDEILHSEIGESLSWTGSEEYQDCQYNMGSYSNDNSNYITFPGTGFTPNAFTVEFWLKTDWDCVSGTAQETGYYSYFQWYYDNDNRIMAQIDHTGCYLNIRGEGVHNYQYWTPSQLNWQAGDIVHLAWVYNRDGIDGTTDTKRLYFNGNVVASTTEQPEAFSVSGGMFYLLQHQDLSRTLKGTVDNLKIYDYAKTDFSDRFNEGTALSITLEPLEAVDAGAQWRLTGGPDTDWHDSEETLLNLPAGTYNLNFKNVIGWAKPSNQTIEIIEGQATTATGTYELLAKSSVTCLIEPPEAIADGAKWKLTTGPDTEWHESGEVLNDIPVGSYKVKFKNIYGWEKPVNQTIEVVEGVTAEAYGLYELLPLSSVTVIIEPPGAVADGAKWRLTKGPDTGWHESGDIITDIPIGTYNIRFKTITGWAKPEDQALEIVEGVIAEGYGEYTLLPLSSMTCTIEPPDAVAAGAQWRLTGGPDTSWHASGDVLNDIPIGNYTIKFKTIYGWEKPVNQSIEVVEGSTASATGIYTEVTAKGSVSITIEPPEAVAVGAQWRLMSGPDNV